MIFGADSLKSALNDSPAAEALLARGLPTRSVEAWKYTNLTLLTEGTWAVAERLPEDELPERSFFPSMNGPSITLLNGRLVQSWSSYGDVAGVSVSQAAGTNPAATSSGEKRVFQVELNEALGAEAVVIEIAAKTILREPLIINHFSFGGDSLNKWSAAAPKIIVHVGRGSEVVLAEVFATDGRTVSVPVTQIVLEQASRVSHARFNLSQTNAVQLGYVQVTQARDSFCETYQFTLGGRLNREDLDIFLNEPGAEAVLDGLYLADGKRHVDHSTNVEHVAPNTTSSQLYKGILNDESKAVFNGRVRIHRIAQQSNASQLNNNLVMSKRAEIDTKPELEIDADDVKASHGATIGQIDPEHVFYLKARAIPEQQAIQMLAKGFAQDVAFRIQSEPLRVLAEKIVNDALAKSGALDRVADTALAAAAAGKIATPAKGKADA